MPKLTAIRKQALDEMMREAIFQAAKAVLAKHGVDGMTMDRVAVEADVAKGSLYHYFFQQEGPPRTGARKGDGSHSAEP